MNTARLRAAIHQAVDLVIDAIEDEDPAPLAKPVAAPRASRRGAALRMFKPTVELSEEDKARGRAMLRQKGIV